MWWLKLHESLAEQNDPSGLLQRYIDAVYLPFWRREFDAEDLQAIIRTLQQIDGPVEGSEILPNLRARSLTINFRRLPLPAAFTVCLPTYCPTKPMSPVRPADISGGNISRVFAGHSSEPMALGRMLPMI